MSSPEIYDNGPQDSTVEIIKVSKNSIREEIYLAYEEISGLPESQLEKDAMSATLDHLSRCVEIPGIKGILMWTKESGRLVLTHVFDELIPGTESARDRFRAVAEINADLGQKLRGMSPEVYLNCRTATCGNDFDGYLSEVLDRANTKNEGSQSVYKLETVIQFS